MYLESRRLAANTINQQLAAVRRLAHEAADAGLLSPELAAGISRVKGVQQLGFRAGNWLSADECSAVLSRAGGTSLRAKRDYAMLVVLFGCGLRRSELVGLDVNDIQVRQGHWAVVDLIGKGGHIRTVPIPKWVKADSGYAQNFLSLLDEAAQLGNARLIEGVRFLSCKRLTDVALGQQAAILAGIDVPDASKSLLRVSASMPHRQDGAACAAHDFMRSGPRHVGGRGDMG